MLEEEDMSLFIPDNYINALGSIENTEKAIKAVKDMFQENLSAQLALLRVTAPMVVLSGTGLNDELNGVERPVEFPIKEQRTLAFLKSVVRRIYEAIKVTENKLYVEFPQIEPMLPEDIFFIHAEQLRQMYPEMSPKERENAVVREHKAVFIIGIGGPLADGVPHDGRAADYDDWSTENEDGLSGLNGDLLLWNPVLESAFEISSMGIRVDETALDRQLQIRGEDWKRNLMYHKMLLEGKLPYTIGGGIGQSRLCMFLLRKAHIGEIQSSIWPEEMRERCRQAGIELV